MFFKIPFAYFLILFFVSVQFASCQTTKEVTVGAYYFDGWTGKTMHASARLKEDFPERKPIWGWVTSTPEVLEEQMRLASEAGIDFFNFCWYYNPRETRSSVGNDSKNNALKIFRDVDNRYDMNYTIMVTNHIGYKLKKKDWPLLVKRWVELMSDDFYMQSDLGKPLLSFFSLKSLYDTFETTEAIKKAFSLLRSEAIKSGFNGVEISVCDAGTPEMIKKAELCGVNYITGYNHQKFGFEYSKKRIESIERMAAKEQKLWSLKSKLTSLKQIPTVTLNWDPRPMQKHSGAKIFSGFSAKSVKKAVLATRVWVDTHKESVSKKKLIMLYAWNEYAEGAWLTPSEVLGTTLLDGLKEGLNTPIK
ncbi:hypothetical protein MED217_13656 [Leeuwenhoekiella blandensis MED217]|uniref:Uncharacterized protein n=2 Tax=Leeuwenhoekiella TaxID=283735 RepID=A3XR76_LEEBM|nr:hypothetical protein MED217_13656 [Leeuwenhoekiella blandensis MED217]